MAYGDYQHCKVCGKKTFYDANIDWDSQCVGVDEEGEVAVTSLCDDCAKTHRIVVIPKEEPR